MREENLHPPNSSGDLLGKDNDDYDEHGDEDYIRGIIDRGIIAWSQLDFHWIDIEYFG